MTKEKTPEPVPVPEPEPTPETHIRDTDGRLIPVPSGVWFVDTDGNGNPLLVDGYRTRRRSPHRPPPMRWV